MKNIILLFIVFLALQSCGNNSTVVLEKIWESDTILTTSESAIYDEVNDVIYVSCINHGPREKDGKGFISKLDLKGNIIEHKWATGMHAPKGMGLYKGILYVADITELISIDTRSGDIKNKISVRHAGMLNDITISSNGILYFTDTDSNKIYVLQDGNIEPFLDFGLKSPNGLLAEDNRLLLASMGYQALFTIDYASRNKEVVAEGLNKADGIIKLKTGDYIVSDWFGELFLIDVNKTATSLISTKEAGIGSADLGYIPRKNMVLVPTFNSNTLVAYKVK